MRFLLKSKFKPAGDQPSAIAGLLKSIASSNKYQTLLGVTGSGKTFTVANVIAKLNRPVLVIAHNKTLAAQLTQEFRDFFPQNAVEYFVSYYDYYQPEAYLPASDTYIEKDASINKEIERMRSAATASLISRRDVIVVASVSCIYGLGEPESYAEKVIQIKRKEKISRDAFIHKLIDIGYERSEDKNAGTFRVRGGSVEIITQTKDFLYRIEFEEEEIVSLEECEIVSHNFSQKLAQLLIYPTRHFVIDQSKLKKIIPQILQEMKKRVHYFLKRKLYLSAERLERRVTQDMAMLEQVGYVGGIENYSRYLTGRKPGEPPYTLLDYFPKDFITIMDESHVTLPQLGGMFQGDQSRKKNLIKYGFRLPSALDNRPLNLQEFKRKINQIIFTSATPALFERKNSPQIIEQIIRPTGLVDPKIEIRKSREQIKEVITEIQKEAKSNRILVTTLTKKMAEELSEYLKEKKIKACYLHSDVDTLDRIGILNDLRRGKYRVLVGVNLLREGLDLPEVSLVAILDADKEGFLRNETSLIQTIGRAARNVQGRVILWGEKETGSMKRAVGETNRRRKIQLAYNKKKGITPRSIKKKIRSIVAEDPGKILMKEGPREYLALNQLADVKEYLKEKNKEMELAAKNLEFEKAALIRDEIKILKNIGK